VGIDLHRRRSVVARIDGQGELLESVRIDNSPEALVAEVSKAGVNPKVALEATFGWYWAVDALQKAGAEVHLVHPRGLPTMKQRRVKTEFRDARELADLLRINRLAESYIAPPELRALRELVRHRHKLCQQRTGLRPASTRCSASAG
jgi:transposase